MKQSKKGELKISAPADEVANNSRKIVLVRPPFRDAVDYRPQPAGLCSIGGYVKHKRPSYRIKIIDSVGERLNVFDTVEAILKYNPFIVGITAKTPQAPQAYEIARIVRKKKGIPVVFGGNHATAKPEEALSEAADIVVVGEGEATFVDLLDHYTEGKISRPIAGTVVSIDEGVKFGPSRPPASNIDEFGGPDWSLIDLSLYNENIHIHHHPALQIMASRGCRFKCSFCSTHVIWNNQIRWRDPDRVVDELQVGLEQFGYTCFHFYDDNFLAERTWLEEFLNELKARSLPIEWHCIVRADDVIHCVNLLKKMRETGCIGFAFGFEAGNDEIFRKQSKDLSISVTDLAIQHLEKHNFNLIEPLLMNLYPGETIRTIIASAQYILKLQRHLGHRLQISRYYATPFPGTSFFQTCRQDGILLAETWDQHFTHFVNFMPHSLLENPIRGVQFNQDLYTIFFKMLFRKHGDYSSFLIPDEIGQFLDCFEEDSILDTFSALITKSHTVNDLIRSFGSATGLTQSSATELVAKIMIHAASCDCLRIDSSDGKS